MCPVSKFELYLPQGRGSALAANGNLCKLTAKLVMPTTIVAQNGAQLKQSTKIAVEGCASIKHGKKARSALRGAGGTRSHSTTGQRGAL